MYYVLMLIEVLKLLQDMPGWMSALVLVIVLLLALGYVLEKVTGR